MRAGKYGLAFLLAALAATILQTLPNRASQLHAAPLPPRFEDRAEFKYGGGGVSATGIRGKGGYTVVPLEAVAGCTKLSVSFAVKEDQKRDVSDFRILAVDGNGKRTAARAESKVSAGGDGIMIVTLVSEFNLDGDKIDSLVIQQRARGKK